MQFDPRRFVKLASGLVVPKRPALFTPKRLGGLTRRAFLAGLGASIITPTPALANFSAAPGFAVACLPVSLTYVSIVGDTANGTNYTFTSQSYGAVVPAGNARHLLACISGVASSTAGDITSATISANATTRVASAGSVGRPMACFLLTDNALTSGQVACVFAQTQVHAACAVFQLVNPISTTPTNTSAASANATSVNTTLTTPPCGVGLAMASPNVLSGALSWTIDLGTITEVYDFNVDGGAGTNVGGAVTGPVNNEQRTVTVTQVESGNVIQIFTAGWN